MNLIKFVKRINIKRTSSFYYQFDTAGRMIALATTRSNAYANVNLNTLLASGETLNDDNVPAFDVTQWRFNDSTGLLTNKVYADEKGIAYTYTDTGRLQTRTQARGITTSYTYSDLGQLTNVNYPWPTPDVTYTHDRLGRILSAISTASTNLFHYEGLTLDYETQNGYTIDRTQDTLGRNNGYSLYNPADPVNPVQKIIYSYDTNGRFSSVTSVHSQLTNQFYYSYLPDTSLISGKTATSSVGNYVLDIGYSFEPNRNLITTVSNTWNSTAISAFTYSNDAIGRRTKPVS